MIGMRNCIGILETTVMIPGHIQELGHSYVPGNPTSRVPYEWAFEVDDVPIVSEDQVMAWGERYLFHGNITIGTESWKGPSLPGSFVLHPAYPNPFNSVSTIQYELPQDSEVSLIVYDILGHEVASLMDGYMEPGHHQAQWDGHGFPSGIYIARLVTPKYAQSIKMVLLK